jgi:ParB-like chromosome segregation protein Spo0J
MEIIQVALNDLKLLDKNPRKHSQLQLKELKRSVEMFGQIRPLIIDEDNVVLAGNGLLTVLRELDRSEADALRLVGLSEFSKKRLILADNKIAALGSDDFSVIEELIYDLRDELDIPGFDDDILRSLVAPPQELKEISNSYGVIDQSFREQAEKNWDQANKDNNSREASIVKAPPTSAVSYSVCESCGQKVWS